MVCRAHHGRDHDEGRRATSLRRAGRADTGLEIDEISIQIFDTTAIVRGRTRATAGGDAPAEVTLRFTDVFIRRDGQWQVVACHATRIGSSVAPGASH